MNIPSQPPEALARALADHYRLERELGAGGMATVYLAHDLKHDRDVAIKVLHPELAAALGGDRFLSEIKTTAKLQHPHILPLLDSGAGGGFLYYVMPYVTGETLRARLERERQLPMDDALRIAREVADALGSAHALGIIHRDIKPENILLQGGHALVADFGISLAVQSAGGARMTQTGLSLGTPQYMSPEQAMGEKHIDLRSDIYALGAVTYEMVTGDPPFTGSSVQSIVAKVLTEKPTTPSAVRDTVSPGVEQAILRALAKLPADRYGTAHEFAEALDGRGAAPGAGSTPTPRRGAKRSVRAWQAATVVLAGVAVIAAGVAMREWASARSAADAAPVIRTRFDLPAGARIADALVGPTLAVSPDGSTIAFTSVTVNGFRMYLRRVNDLAAREIADANLAGRNLAFSPDGKWLAFTEGNAIKKISVDGGAVINIGPSGGSVPYGLSWSVTDTIYIGSFSGLFSIPASGGDPKPVAGTETNGPRMGKRWPVLLPGGRAVAFTRGNSSSSVPQLSVLEIASGRVTEFTLQVAMPLGVLDDQLIFVAATGGLMTVRIDVRTGRPLGEPMLLEDDVLVDPTAGAKASLSRSGTLAFMRGRAQFQPVLVAASGAASPLLDEPRAYSNPRYSPDGRRVAFTVHGTSSTDVWIYDVGRNTFSPLTTEGSSVRPEWTEDGKFVVFISERGGHPGIWRQPADGTGTAELVYEPEIEPFEAIVSPDMSTLVYRTAPGMQFPRDILAVPYAAAPGAKRTVTPLVTGPYSENMPRFSRDGKWIAYQSNAATRFEIYVRPFPSNGQRVQVSNAGGAEPLWGRDGRTLYYRGPNGEVVQVAVSTGDTFTIGPSRTLFRGDYLEDSTHPNWDVAADGRFLMLKRAGAESQMVVVHGWGRELRARLAGRK